MSLGWGSRLPQFGIVRKLLECLVVARWFEQREDPVQYCIDDKRCMLHIQINGLEPISKMEFGVVV